MTIHQFSPSVYYNTIGSHEPVLKIQDGDTVVTTAVDYGGMDSSGARCSWLHGSHWDQFSWQGFRQRQGVEKLPIREIQSITEP